MDSFISLALNVYFMIAKEKDTFLVTFFFCVCIECIGFYVSSNWCIFLFFYVDVIHYAITCFT